MYRADGTFQTRRTIAIYGGGSFVQDYIGVWGAEPAEGAKVSLTVTATNWQPAQFCFQGSCQPVPPPSGTGIVELLGKGSFKLSDGTLVTKER